VRCATRLNFMICILQYSEIPPRVSSRSRLKCYMQRKSRCLRWFQLMVPLDAMCNESELPDFVALRNIPRFCLEITPFPTETQGRCISNQQKIIENLMQTLEENELGDHLLPGELSAASQSSNDLPTSQFFQGIGLNPQTRFLLHGTAEPRT